MGEGDDGTQMAVNAGPGAAAEQSDPDRKRKGKQEVPAATKGTCARSAPLLRFPAF
jgi:hypothetical protein